MTSNGRLPPPPAARRGRPGPWPSNPDPPPAPLTWAKRTGFKGQPSGDSNASNSGQIPLPEPDLESGRPQTLPPPTAPANGGVENKERATAAVPVRPATEIHTAAKKRRSNSDGGAVTGARNGPQQPRSDPQPALPPQEEDDAFRLRRAHINYELRDTPGLVPIVFYGLQHLLSILGSLILIPLVIVPAMGGTDEDTSEVVSIVLFISGLATLLHTHFGTRLPLIQGPSFVYLAPALAIINSAEFQGLNGNNFKHIMKQLQGALIISSAFQAMLGYSGIMSLLLRLINPVVVSPTVAAIGLSFFSYGFTQVGNCLEIGLLQILLIIIFSLYLRKIHIFGHRIFLIYAVPLALGVTWSIAFLLTEFGFYNYESCDTNVPASNTVSAYCRKHVPRMKHCRVDTSHDLRPSPWFRFPYPLQWGIPVFNWKMALVMCGVSIIASVDSAAKIQSNGNFGHAF